MQVETIGLDGEQRADPALRDAFKGLYDLLGEYLDESGNWRSASHEALALGALGERHPDITGMRLFSVLTRVASLRSAGREPV
jgi:hypothetical protein